MASKHVLIAASETTRRAARYWAKRRSISADDLILRWGLAAAIKNPTRTDTLATANYHAGLTAYDTLAVLAGEYVAEYDLDGDVGGLEPEKVKA